MVTPLVRRPWFYTKVAGVPVSITSDYTQTEAMAGAVSRVLQFEVTGTPTMTTGQTVALEAVDLEAGISIDQFSGVINNIRGTGYPNQVQVTCTGPLARLRRTRPTDLDLSDLTEREAVLEVLSYCGVPYTTSDIAGNDYVLGQRTPVIWAAGQSGAEMINEFDRVFGYATTEIGAGRVIRFAYDLVPDAADIEISFHRGNSSIYYAVERNRGDLDAIQNYWQVTGVGYECDECQCTIYANAQSSHPKLGAGVYVAPQTFSSELIQDENLAAAIATRQMRWYNREPDIVYVETINTPAVAPGITMGVNDQAFGIDLSSEKPYLITAIDRRGDIMRLTGIGGTAGATGTVTSGASKQCNDINTNIPDPPDLGGFPGFPAMPDLPGFEGPPVPFPDIQRPPPTGEKDPPDDEPDEPEPDPGDFAVSLSGWVEVFPEISEGPSGGVRFTEFGIAYHENIDFPDDVSWRIEAAFEFLQTDTILEIGVGPSYITADMTLTLFTSEQIPPSGTPRWFQMFPAQPPELSHSGTGPIQPGSEITLVWEYHNSGTSEATITVDGAEYGLSGSAGVPDGPLLVHFILSSGSDGYVFHLHELRAYTS
jgi:hypothetical protein